MVKIKKIIEEQKTQVNPEPQTPKIKVIEYYCEACSFWGKSSITVGGTVKCPSCGRVNLFKKENMR